jgi:hypothetical protein
MFNQYYNTLMIISHAKIHHHLNIDLSNTYLYSQEPTFRLETTLKFWASDKWYQFFFHDGWAQKIIKIGDPLNKENLSHKLPIKDVDINHAHELFYTLNKAGFKGLKSIDLTFPNLNKITKEDAEVINYNSSKKAYLDNYWSQFWNITKGENESKIISSLSDVILEFKNWLQ